MSRPLPLGPLEWMIFAPREVVFDVISSPYLERTPRALASKLEVLERRRNSVVAAHYTRVLGGRVRVTTVERVTFRRPSLVTFRLLRGPVSHVKEVFELTEDAGSTRFVWRGELSSKSRLWSRIVARRWTAVVRHSVAEIAAEAERRAG